MFAHQVGGFVRRHLGRYTHNVAAHNVTDGPVELAVLGDRANHDVAIRHDAYRSTVVHHRHRSRIAVAHDARGILNAVGRPYVLRVRCHHFANIHELLLCGPVTSCQWVTAHNRASTSAWPFRLGPRLMRIPLTNVIARPATLQRPQANHPPTSQGPTV